jgi:hypothetical protein
MFKENKVKEVAKRYWVIKQAEKRGACSTHAGNKESIKIYQDTMKDIGCSAILK